MKCTGKNTGIKYPQGCIPSRPPSIVLLREASVLVMSTPLQTISMIYMAWELPSNDVYAITPESGKDARVRGMYKRTLEIMNVRKTKNASIRPRKEQNA